MNNISKKSIFSSFLDLTSLRLGHGKVISRRRVMCRILCTIDHKPFSGTLLLPRYFSQLQPSLDTNEEFVFVSKGENFTDIQTEKQRN